MAITAVGVEEASKSTLPLSVYEQEPFCRSSLGALFSSMARRYSDAYRTAIVTLYDVTAVAAAVRPEWFELESLRVAVELEGEVTRGMTVVEQDTYFNSVPGSRLLAVVRGHDDGAVLDLFTTAVLQGEWPRQSTQGA
jgi:inosine-uridine nucleoside N-ribohydrolase